jgi:hypothetical protein
MVLTGKAVSVEPSVWAEGVDAERWPELTYCHYSHWARTPVPHFTDALYARLDAEGLPPMEPGLRLVLGGQVACPILITRTLINGKKGWGLRVLKRIPAVRASWRIMGTT